MIFSRFQLCHFIFFMEDPRSVKWCFTMNNFADKGWSDWKKYLSSLKDQVEYLVCEEEVGENNTPHLQGYIRFKYAKRFSTLKRFFDDKAHIEIARGSDNDNCLYCTKDGKNVYELGTMKGKQSNKGVDFEKLMDDFISLSSKEFYRSHPREALMYFNKLQTLASAICCEDNQTIYKGDLKIKNYWIYGPPGTGKSRWARHTSKNVYLKTINKWWSGYNSRFDVVLMEDFPCLDQTKGIYGQHMKLWADRYTFTAETKGGHCFVHPKDYCLIVTSNYPIDQCFALGDVEAISRRFNQIRVEENDIFFMLELEVWEILHNNNCSADHALHCT